MDYSTPFVHAFETLDRKYLYDVNTNRILEVQDIVWDIIHYYGRLSVHQITEKFRGKYNLERILQGIKHIQAARKEGLFSADRPQQIRYPKARAEAMDLLETELGGITLGVTEDCNMRCRYCVYGGNYRMMRTHARKYMDFHVAKQAIDYYLAHSIDSREQTGIHIGYYGGEPLLNFSLIKQCVGYIHEVSPRFPSSTIHHQMTTNGTLLTDEVTDFLIKNDVSLLVSLDGPQPRHDANRVFSNNKGTFDHIVSNLEKIKRKNPDYYRFKVDFIAVVAPPVDYMEVHDFFASAETVGEHSSIIVSSVSPKAKYLETFTLAELINPEGKETLWRKYVDAVLNRTPRDPLFCWENALSLFLFETDLLPLYKRGFYDQLPQSHHPGGICLPGMKKLFISPEGRFYVCEKVHYVSNDDDLFCIGNVEQGIDHEKVCRLIDEYSSSIQEDCCRCWLNRMCKVCFATIELDEHQKITAGTKRPSCRDARANVHEALVRYCSVLEQDSSAFDFMEEMSSR